jgi:two-component system OmpR family response regulator
MALILLVDDNRNVREFWVRHLRRLGYGAVAAANGHEAELAVGTRAPDVIVLDVEMPGNGRAFINWMLSNDRDIPVVLYAADDQHAALVGEGAVVGFVPKTDNPSVLLRKIAEVLGDQPLGPGSSREGGGGASARGGGEG